MDKGGCICFERVAPGNTNRENLPKERKSEMKKMKKVVLLTVMAALVMVGMTQAQDISTDIRGDITSHMVLTKANSPYNLVGLVYVRPGWSLTIEPGVVVATKKVGPGFREGSLAVCRGAQLFVNGTQQEPVIFTSAEDLATWAGSKVGRSGVPAAGYDQGYVTSIEKMGNPKTGTWRPKCFEWGSIAILGNGYISRSHYGDQEPPGNPKPATWDEDLDQDPATTGDVVTHTNTKCPNVMNKARMEGLEPEFPGDVRILYGGDNDNDNSGSISFLSIRYGGKVIIDTDELNGLSLGAIGRATDIHHVEIMNNVDDGIELWGGTVNLYYVNIWNIGDDSFDFDEGWRGMAKYGLIVQGYSRDDEQGSGVGDNCFEHDGAENANAQPVTTARIENFTAIGQPGTNDNNGGDGGTVWRDNARVQYDRCVWMDIDDELVKFDCQDKDGAAGYDGDDNDSTKLVNNDPPDGTMNWYEHWTTSYNTWITDPLLADERDPVEGAPFPAGSPCNYTANDFQNLYGQWMVQDPAGRLCQITNSVFYNIGKYDMYDEVSALTIGDGANNVGNVKSTVMPIKEITRAVEFITTAEELSMQQVEYLNPMPAGDALTKGAGAFSVSNWLADWTAADAFGFVDTFDNSQNFDFNFDGKINLLDFAKFAEQFLTGWGS